jgi:hypothetical protein
MIVSNRKLFKKRPARDNLNQVAGIMASSPELMNEVQRFDNGGNVQLPGSVGSIVQLLDAVKSIQLPELTVRPGSFMDKIGASLSGKKEVPLDPDEIAARTSAQRGTTVVSEKLGERGYAVFRNGSLVGYQSVDATSPKVNKMTQEIKQELIDRKGPSVPVTSISDFTRKLVGADAGASDAFQAYSDAKRRGELGIQNSRLMDYLNSIGIGRGRIGEGILTLPLAAEAQVREIFGDVGGDAMDYLRQLTPDMKGRMSGETVPDVELSGPEYSYGVKPRAKGEDTELEFTGSFPTTGPTDQAFSVLNPEGFRQPEISSMEDMITQSQISENEIQAMIDNIRRDQQEEQIQQADRASMEALPAFRESEFQKKIDDIQQADRASMEALPAFRKEQKKEDSVQELQRQVDQENQFEQKQNQMASLLDPEKMKGFEPIGSSSEKVSAILKEKINKENTEESEKAAIADQVVQETTKTDMKSLMEEFVSQAPEYEGMNKGLAIAKMGFAIAAGESPNGLTNIAKGLEKGVDLFMKDNADKAAFDRQIALAAFKYGLEGEAAEKAQLRSDMRNFDLYVVGSEGFTDPRPGKNKKYHAPGSHIELSMADRMKYAPFMESLASIKGLKDYAELFGAEEIDPAKASGIISQAETARDLINRAEDAVRGIGIFDEVKKLVNDPKTAPFARGFKGFSGDVFTKGATFFGVQVDKKYDTQAQIEDMMLSALGDITSVAIGDTQSANSISDRDVLLNIIKPFFGGLIQQDANGKFSINLTSKERVNAKIDSAISLLLKKQRQSIQSFDSIASNLARVPKVTGYEGTGLDFIKEEQKRRSVFDLGGQGGFSQENMPIFDLGYDKDGKPISMTLMGQ